MPKVRREPWDEGGVLSEETVRKILLTAQKELKQAELSLRSGQQLYSPDWEASVTFRIGQAIDKARDLLMVLDEDTRRLFERYRIAELRRDLQETLSRLRPQVAVVARQPDSSSLQRGKLQKRLKEFYRDLESYRPQDALPPETLAEVRTRLTACWMELGPELNLFPDLRQNAIQRWEAHWNLLSRQKSTPDPSIPYEKVTRKHLPKGCQPWDSPGIREGLFYQCYENGQLKKVGLFRAGELVEEIELELGVSAARFEDSANVAEFRPDGGVEEYGGRYERTTPAPPGFREWVCQKISQMGN